MSLETEVERVVCSMIPGGAPPIHGDTDLVFDLGFDSFRLIELVAALEDAFGTRFSEDRIDLEGLRTLSSIIRTVRSQLDADRDARMHDRR